jgi:hypothetical protein
MSSWHWNIIRFTIQVCDTDAVTPLCVGVWADPVGEMFHLHPFSIQMY